MRFVFFQVLNIYASVCSLPKYLITRVVVIRWYPSSMYMITQDVYKFDNIGVLGNEVMIRSSQVGGRQRKSYDASYKRHMCIFFFLAFWHVIQTPYAGVTSAAGWYRCGEP